MTAFWEELRMKTEEYGGEWGKNHCLRLLRAIGQIRGNLSYAEDVLTMAVWLHDWGAYPKLSEPGKDHAVRSMELAKCFLNMY